MRSHFLHFTVLLASLGVTACVTRPQQFAPVPSNPVAAYRVRCLDTMEPIWRRETERAADRLGLGQAVIAFEIPVTGGHARNVKVVSNTGTDGLSEVAVRTVPEAVLPPMPRDVAAVLNNQPLFDQEAFTVNAATPKH